MKMGRFVVDGHIHPGKKDHASDDSKIKGVNAQVEEADNSDMILLDMDAYGIDMGIILPSMIGTTNALHADMVRRHPDRFRSMCVDTKTRLAAAKGEKEWNINDAIKELDEALSLGPDIMVGIGEIAPGSLGCPRERPTRAQRFKEWCTIAELATHYDVPCYFHDYSHINMEAPLTMMSSVLQKYPGFKLIIAHGGGQTEDDIKSACYLAGLFEHVYLETGYWCAEYYEYALKNYQIGASKLIWGGGDTGSRIWYPQATQPGLSRIDPTFIWYNRNNWALGDRELCYQPDYYGWSTHQIHRLKDMELCTQDEINLIIGGNAARLYKIKLDPRYTFCYNRPDLHIPDRATLESTQPTWRTGFVNPPDQDFVSGEQDFYL
ncbi:MAG: amidohydrolase [Oscillospiraceae bacterium]|nr:amidohydrolase [Oscillospiraceae bacterium]